MSSSQSRRNRRIGKEAPLVKARRQAMMKVGELELLVVQMDRGDKVFDTLVNPPKLLGVVDDKHPVINGETVYLSHDDFEAAVQATKDTGGYTINGYKVH